MILSVFPSGLDLSFGKSAEDASENATTVGVIDRPNPIPEASAGLTRPVTRRPAGVDPRDPMNGDDVSGLKVLLIADTASMAKGGEASLVLHYFRRLLERGVDARLICHSRTREELELDFPDAMDRIHMIADTRAQAALWLVAKRVPDRVRSFTIQFLMRILSQRQACKIARQVIAQNGINLIHQPIPVSPKEPSMFHSLGVPLVIGPMNGGMDYPRAFRRLESRWADVWFKLGRRFADQVNNLMPGKKRAALLLVANQRTEQALPSGCRGRVLRLVENGVDLNLWKPIDFEARAAGRDADEPLRLVWMGRMVRFKALSYLLKAYKALREDPTFDRKIVLELVGDGPDRQSLEDQCRELGLEIGRDIIFSGWMLQAQVVERVREADVLLLPSLAECGGAVVMEAMAMGLPCIAADWGGPQDYIVHGETGYLVPVDSNDALVDGLTRSMKALSLSDELRLRMGQAGRRRVERLFDWEQKVDTMISLYLQVIESRSVLSSEAR